MRCNRIYIKEQFGAGHYVGSPGIEAHIVYVAQHDDGSQRTYTPTEFAAKFNWKNEPEKTELLGK